MGAIDLQEIVGNILGVGGRLGDFKEALNKYVDIEQYENVTFIKFFKYYTKFVMVKEDDETWVLTEAGEEIKRGEDRIFLEDDALLILRDYCYNKAVFYINETENKGWLRSEVLIHGNKGFMYRRKIFGRTLKAVMTGDTIFRYKKKRYVLESNPDIKEVLSDMETKNFTDYLIRSIGGKTEIFLDEYMKLPFNEGEESGDE